MSGTLFQIISNNYSSSIIAFNDSDITFFKLVYHKYKNFSIEQNTHPFFTPPQLNEQPIRNI